MTSTAIRQTPWFQSRKWFTNIHFDQDNLKEVSRTYPVFKDIIDKLEKDDEALKHDDADWASHIRAITGVTSDTSDFARTIMPPSISRAVKTLLAYRALDITCHVLELAPERNSPQPMAKPDNQNAAIETLDIGNWAQDILDMEQLLEAHWARSSSSSISSSSPPSTTLGPTTWVSNNPTEQVIRSMQQNILLSSSGRRSEKLHRFLASFHEVSAVMGYIITHGTTHLPNLPADLIKHCGKPASNDVTLSYVLSASSSPIMLFTKYIPSMKNPHKYLDFWSDTSFDASFRIVEKALWTALVRVMMGHLDAKAGLRQFFRDSRDVLNVEKANLVSVPAPPKKKNKRKLPSENISNDDVATQVAASCTVAPATKKTKLYAPVCDSGDQPRPLADPSQSFGGMEDSAGPDASKTTATPMNFSGASPLAMGSYDPMTQDVPSMPEPDVDISPSIDDPMDLDEPMVEDMDHRTLHQTPAALMTTPTRENPPTPKNDPTSATPPTTNTTPTRNPSSPPPKKVAPPKLGPSKSTPTTASSKNTACQPSRKKKDPPTKKTSLPPSCPVKNKSQSRSSLSDPKNTNAAAQKTKSSSTTSTSKQISASISSTGSGPTTSNKSSPTTSELGQCHLHPTGPQKSLVERMIAMPTQSAAFSSKKNDAPLQGTHVMKKEEDRINDLLASRAGEKRRPARVIYWDMTELEDWPEISDVGSVASHKVVFASESASYPVAGSETSRLYQSAGHGADANAWFNDLYERSDVIKATPKANQSLVLYEMEVFRALDSGPLQSTFRTHHILVNADKSYVPPKFDKRAVINILKLESKPFLFIDQSEPEEVQVYKKLKDLLEQVECDGSLTKSGRIYTIFKTPTTDGPQPDSRIATDIHAFHATVDRPLCHNRAFPLLGTQWATLSTPHAVQHYQDSGLGTYIHLEIGYLFLFISKSDDHVSLRTKQFPERTFEVALLAPGSSIYLQPHTVCYSVSSTACAIRGGHFMSCSTLQKTALGILQTFDVFSEQKTSSLDMILYLVTMFHGHWILKTEEENLVAHSPDIDTLDGMLDVFHICVIAEMGAILHPPRYQEDVVYYSDKHRQSFMLCRHLAYEILQFLDSSYEFMSPSGRRNQVSNVYLYFLVRQVQAFLLQQVRICPSSNDLQRVPNHLDAISGAIARCFHGKKKFWKAWQQRSQPEHRSTLRYGFHGPAYKVVRRIDPAIQSGEQLSRALFDPGMEDLEEEEDNEELDPEIRRHMAEMMGWAKS